jgi:predicted Zn-dependent protease
MYVNRGMIEAAKTEGEVAGVMAHELSHVALRHGTAQASTASKYQLGAIAGQVLGAIIGGNVGSVVAQGSQFGLGTAFMRFSREYERQANLAKQKLARLQSSPRPEEVPPLEARVEELRQAVADWSAQGGRLEAAGGH